MSRPPFEIWLIKKLQKIFQILLKLWTFEQKENYGDGTDYFASMLSWLLLWFIILFSGVFFLPTIEGRMRWISTTIQFCLIVSSILALKAKYQEEMSDDE